MCGVVGHCEKTEKNDGFSCRSLKTTASRRFKLEVQSQMQLPECLGVPLINISGTSLARFY